MRTLAVILGTVLVAGLWTPASATSFIVDFWQDEYSETCDELRRAATALHGCILCHTSGGSSSDLNPYAEDIQDVHDLGGTWPNAIQTVDPDDSDGDGVSNNVEILTNCTYPGDATNPVEGETWGGVKALYR